MCGESLSSRVDRRELVSGGEIYPGGPWDEPTAEEVLEYGGGGAEYAALGLEVCAVETLRPLTDGYWGECVLSMRGFSKSRLCIDGSPSLYDGSAHSKMLENVFVTYLERLSPSNVAMVLEREARAYV